MTLSRIRIGTRAVRWPSGRRTVKRRSEAHPHLAGDDGVDITIIRTSNDRLQQVLSEVGGKGLFTKEMRRLLEGSIDMAVHL